MIDDTFLTHALDTGAALTKAQTVTGREPFLVVPDGYSTLSLDEFREKPARIKQAIKVFDVKSFTAYFTDYCADDSRVFVDKHTPRIRAVIDYHSLDSAAWGDHTLEYQFRHTPEWLTWAGSNKKEFSQADFAAFIEDNLPDIIAPDPATMIEVSRTLEAKKNVTFGSAVRLANGEVQFAYSEEIRGTAGSGTIEIPETFDLSIRPFEGSEPYRVTARFRYKLTQETLKLRYELVRPHKILEDAINTVVTQIEAGISNPITLGSL